MVRLSMTGKQCRSSARRVFPVARTITGRFVNRAHLYRRPEADGSRFRPTLRGRHLETPGFLLRNKGSAGRLGGSEESGDLVAAAPAIELWLRLCLPPPVREISDRRQARCRESLLHDSRNRRVRSTPVRPVPESPRSLRRCVSAFRRQRNLQNGCLLTKRDESRRLSPAMVWLRLHPEIGSRVAFF